MPTSGRIVACAYCQSLFLLSTGHACAHGNFCDQDCHDAFVGLAQPPAPEQSERPWPDDYDLLPDA